MNHLSSNSTKGKNKNITRNLNDLEIEEVKQRHVLNYRLESHSRIFFLYHLSKRRKKKLTTLTKRIKKVNLRGSSGLLITRPTTKSWNPLLLFFICKAWTPSPQLENDCSRIFFFLTIQILLKKIKIVFNLQRV